MEGRNHKIPALEIVKADKKTSKKRMIIYHVKLKIKGREKGGN